MVRGGGCWIASLSLRGTNLITIKENSGCSHGGPVLRRVPMLASLPTVLSASQPLVSTVGPTNWQIVNYSVSSIDWASSFAKWHEGKIGTAEESVIVSNLLYPSITLCVRPNASMIEKETEEYENKFPVPKNISDMLNSFKYSVVEENM